MINEISVSKHDNCDLITVSVNDDGEPYEEIYDTLYADDCYGDVDFSITLEQANILIDKLKSVVEESPGQASSATTPGQREEK